jgi:hypothetical protein
MRRDAGLSSRVAHDHAQGSLRGKTLWSGKPLEKEIYVAGPASATPAASYAP